MALVYLVLLGVCYLFDYSVDRKYKIRQRDRKIYLTFQLVFIIFFALLMAFRDETVGPDTKSYLDAFKMSKYKTYENIFKLDENARSKEYLFYALTKFIAGFTDRQIIFFGIFGSIFSFSYGFAVYRYSENYLISYIALLTLYITFIISGMRQVAAMSVLMFSFKYIKERKLLPFLICIFTAYYFHNTSIIFVIAYPIANLKFSKVHIIFLIICSVMAYFLPGVSNKILYEWLAWDKLEVYETYEAQISSSGFIIKLCMLAFTLFHYKDTVKKNPDNIILYNMSVMGTGLQAFTVVMSQAFRMSMYFSIFDTILLANVIQELSMDGEMKKRNKIMLYVGVIGILLFYYFFVAGALKYKMSTNIF